MSMPTRCSPVFGPYRRATLVVLGTLIASLLLSRPAAAFAVFDANNANLAADFRNASRWSASGRTFIQRRRGVDKGPVEARSLNNGISWNLDTQVLTRNPDGTPQAIRLLPGLRFAETFANDNERNLKIRTAVDAAFAAFENRHKGGITHPPLRFRKTDVAITNNSAKTGNEIDLFVAPNAGVYATWYDRNFVGVAVPSILKNRIPLGTNKRRLGRNTITGFDIGLSGTKTFTLDPGKHKTALDFQTTLQHELAHALGIGHPGVGAARRLFYDNNANVNDAIPIDFKRPRKGLSGRNLAGPFDPVPLMLSVQNPGEEKRSLRNDDIGAFDFLYPSRKRRDIPKKRKVNARASAEATFTPNPDELVLGRLDLALGNAGLVENAGAVFTSDSDDALIGQPFALRTLVEVDVIEAEEIIPQTAEDILNAAYSPAAENPGEQFVMLNIESQTSLFQDLRNLPINVLRPGATDTSDVYYLSGGAQFEIGDGTGASFGAELLSGSLVRGDPFGLSDADGIQVLNTLIMSFAGIEALDPLGESAFISGMLAGFPRLTANEFAGVVFGLRHDLITMTGQFTTAGSSTGVARAGIWSVPVAATPLLVALGLGLMGIRAPRHRQGLAAGQTPAEVARLT